MVGQLGDIVFDMLKEPLALKGNKKYTYARHPIIYGNTKLQYTGDEPREYEMQIRFHAMFCNPEDEIKMLHDQATKRGESGFREPLPFILGSGEVQGDYVIEEVEEEMVKHFPDGSILEAIVTVKMTQYL